MVLKGCIEVDDEVKEGFRVGVTDMPGLLLSSFRYFVQKRQDLFQTDPIEHATLVSSDDESPA